MRLVWTEQGWADYLYWESANKKNVNRINALIKDTKRNPFDGIGKPEPLKHVEKGLWSRRITDEHRLVYLVEGDDLIVVQARYHY